MLRPASEHSDTTELLSRLTEKDQLIRSVAHDLRNPLGGISSLATMLIQEKKLSDEHFELLNAIQEAARYSLKLVDELLTDKNAAPDTSAHQAIDVHSVIINYLRFSQHLMDSKEQMVSADLFEGDASLMIDQEKITRVIDNLIGNAIKFTPRCGKISITTHTISNGLQITVKDNGMGIPVSLQPYIFLGQGCRRAGTSGEKSHGLGLSICKTIIEDHGGTIHFQSRAGKGTIFYVWLPRSPLFQGTLHRSR